MNPALRSPRPSERAAVADVHRRSIRELADDAYRPDQIDAWADAVDPDRYPIHAAEAHCLVAERGGRLVGFGWVETEPGEHLDADVDGEVTAVYVHPNAAREGVGSRLYGALEAAVRDRGAESLGLWASRNAVPFYEAQGYDQIAEQRLEYGDVALPVVEMRKRLD